MAKNIAVYGIISATDPSLKDLKMTRELIMANPSHP